jgi:hypothetical protein
VADPKDGAYAGRHAEGRNHMTESMERPTGHGPTGDKFAADHPLRSATPGSEDVDIAQEEEDLEQDPDQVPNRIQQAKPPRPETVEPADSPHDYDPLYDETRED